MAKFDEEKFRASAKAAGYSDEDIEAELKTTPAPSGAAVPNMAPIADGRDTSAAFAAEAKTKQDELVREAAKEKKATLTEPAFDFMSAINSPVGYVTGGAALYALASPLIKKGIEGIKSRSIVRPEIDKTIDIPMDTIEKRNVSPFAQQFETTYGVPLADAERFSGGPITNPKDAAVIGGYLKNQGSLAPNTPYQTSAYTQAPTDGPFFNPNNNPPAPPAGPPSAPPAGPQANAPVAPPAAAPTDPLAPRPNPYITPSVQAGVQSGNPAPAVQAVIAKELDKATGSSPTLATFNRDANGNIQYPKGMSSAARQGAEAFAQQYPDQAKSLAAEGRFGILGAGSGDNNLFNSYGSDMMKRIRNEVNEGQMVGPYANYENKINPAIKGISPETAIGKDLAQLREAQIGGNYGQLGTPASIGGKKGGMIQGTNMVAKAVKAGGPALLLMGIADAANAAQQGKYGEAALRSADVATDYMPIISQLKQGFSPTEAGAPGVSKQRIESAALLGSPYAQTDWAKGQRLKEKAGAGRGIAPPSAYMR
jgi:hypothetical protein